MRNISGLSISTCERARAAEIVCAAIYVPSLKQMKIINNKLCAPLLRKCECAKTSYLLRLRAQKNRVNFLGVRLMHVRN
jgi:hypothetical protein